MTARERSYPADHPIFWKPPAEEAQLALEWLSSPLSGLWHITSRVDRGCQRCAAAMPAPCEWWGTAKAAFCESCWMAMRPAERLAPFMRSRKTGKPLTAEEIDAIAVRAAQAADVARRAALKGASA